jgi:FtsZ-binding cell division protein ZapB
MIYKSASCRKYIRGLVQMPQIYRWEEGSQDSPNHMRPIDYRKRRGERTQVEERSVEEKITLIAQTIDQYQWEIEQLKENLNPMTPLEVKEQRNQKAKRKMDEMERKINTTIGLFDRAT